MLAFLNRTHLGFFTLSLTILFCFRLITWSFYVISSIKIFFNAITEYQNRSKVKHVLLLRCHYSKRHIHLRWYISSLLYYTSIPLAAFYDNIWLKIYHNHYFQGKHENIISIIIGDSIVAGLTWYTNIWKNLFGNRIISLYISGIA